MTTSRPKPCFSRRTVVAAIELMEGIPQEQLTRWLLRWHPNLIDRVGGKAIALQIRLNNLLELLNNEPTFCTFDGEYLLEQLVDQVFAALIEGGPGVTLSAAQEEFRRTLELDGYRISDKAIRRTPPAEIRASEAGDQLSTLLTAHGLSVSQGHLNQAIEAHKRGAWAAANSQIRSFFEGLLDELAIKIDPATATLKERRVAPNLLKKGFCYSI